MDAREFLGWDRPFLTELVEWLLARRDALPEMHLVVPTSQSGRQLREALAEAAGALLSPRVVTPGSFLKARDEEAAPDWLEILAWVEVLEGIDDWSEYVGLFPEAPATEGNWANGLAREMTMLRRSLQENGWLISTAARRFTQTVEAERWQALARLEAAVEHTFYAWGVKSRSRILAEGLHRPAQVTRLVLAGVAEIPPLLERAMQEWGLPVTVLIGAPASESAAFSSYGQPTVQAWSARPLPWPSHGSVQVVSDSHQQAAEAMRWLGEEKTPSNEVALGSADLEVGDELARCLTRHGWPAFHPASPPFQGGLVRWLRVWQEWLAKPSLARMADLLTLPQTDGLIAGKRPEKAKRLAELRDRWMVMQVSDLRRRIESEPFRNAQERISATEVLAAAESLEHWRTLVSGENFSNAMERLLTNLAGAENEPDFSALMDWLQRAAPWTRRIPRSAGFWIEHMISAVPVAAPAPPDERVIDVQGWLELFHEPGRHLILCGMNEGKVPARSGGEPWLSEASRGLLGLVCDAQRAARDAFLYHSMLESRRTHGRVDILCGKAGNGGEPMLPSRLLLAGEHEELPERVKQLFREIEPPEAGLRGQEAEVKWTPRRAEPPQRISVTSLRDYLACPFRYYLKHVLKMQSSEAERVEWNARDFGTIAHEVLERWGRDLQARDSDQADAIQAWLSDELDRVVAENFGQHVPLAVRLQTEALRQRFSWLAEIQAKSRLEGWQVVDVERTVELPAGEAWLIAKIDRIDRHQETGQLRVIDYKTGKIDAVEKAHRHKLTANRQLPQHLDRDGPAVYTGEAGGKSADFLWHNLQLPLYASALVKRGEALPTPCYFVLGKTAAEVAIHEWKDFETDDLSAAEACADWIAQEITRKTFWPPAEKVSYDDFEALSAGRHLESIFHPPE